MHQLWHLKALHEASYKTGRRWTIVHDPIPIFCSECSFDGGLFTQMQVHFLLEVIQNLLGTFDAYMARSVQDIGKSVVWNTFNSKQHPAPWNFDIYGRTIAPKMSVLFAPMSARLILPTLAKAPKTFAYSCRRRWALTSREACRPSRGPIKADEKVYYFLYTMGTY